MELKIKWRKNDMMRKSKLTIYSFVVLFIFSLIILSVNNNIFAQASIKPDVSSLQNHINPTSTRVLHWDGGGHAGIQYTAPTDETSGATLQSTTAVTSGARVLIANQSEIYPDSTVIHTFDVKMDAGEYSWNAFVFRADPTNQNFTAFIFRRFYGHRSLVSWDGNSTPKWASFSVNYPQTGLAQNLYSVTGSAGEQIEVDTVLRVTIKSSKNRVDVWYGDTHVYGQNYALELPPATGIMAWTLGTADMNRTAKFENIKMYDTDVKFSMADNKAVYDGTEKALSVAATHFGNAYPVENLKIEYKLASQADSSYTTDQPINIGHYNVRVSVDPAKDNQNFGKAVFSFVIVGDNIITEQSSPRLMWVVPAGQVAYSYGEQGASLKIEKTTENKILSAAAKISFNAVPDETVIHTFDYVVPNDNAQWDFIPIIVRADNEFNNFTAIAFRKGAGHISIVSRYNGKFYSNSAIAPTESTESIYSLGSSSALAALEAGQTVSINIESSYDSIKLFLNGNLIFTSALHHRIEASAGLLVLTANKFNSYPDIELLNFNCYSKPFNSYFNALTENSIVYSPQGGGGAQAQLTEEGYTLSAGGSVNGLAVISSPVSYGRTVQTFSFNLNTSAVANTQWYKIIIRADDTFENYLAVYVRRKFSHIAMAAQVDGFSVAFSSSEPFEGNNIPVFDPKNIKSQNAPNPEDRDFAEGDRINLTIISDDYGVVIYNNTTIVYEIVYDNLKIREGAPNRGLNITKLPGYLRDLKSVTAMATTTNCFRGASYYNINTYFLGEIEGEDETSKSMLKNIKYKGTDIEGFSPGSFDYDITISENNPLHKSAITFEKFYENAEVSDIIWSKDSKFGFDEAKITVTKDNTSRTYILTFVIYNPPSEFVEDDFDVIDKDDTDGGIVQGCKLYSSSRLVIFIPFLLFAALIQKNLVKKIVKAGKKK